MAHHNMDFISPSYRKRLGSVFVEIAAPSEELPLIGRHFKFVEYSVHRTDGLAVGAIDAYFRIYEIHIFGIGG